MIKKVLGAGIGAIALVGLALIPAGSAQALTPVTAVAACGPDGSGDTFTSVTVAPGQGIAWSITDCDGADWGTLTGPTPFDGPGVITSPYSETTPADSFVCGTDTMEFFLVGGTSAYIEIICGAAAPEPLPDTGANVGAVAGTSALLLGLGLAIVLVVRRRQKA
jgi:LPXTG-motif cell wall-anchored protein